ncbi:hypothetical protein P154DRAFT_526534 [Amniculicola lignicola CBS 123094]|uniref:Large ribosomal subunit protein mL59 domain-containing protein n=1 Tax=Amniculicola lignicola CBS 123094 TaxID=1392246 RepID=A0A6A5W0C7_9PLEO|nr:hypothetical protein P154DRAFT_526534 [Amniculicola lignicola CBS 123094]
MSTKQIQIAQSLPPRLLRFFARYPPPQLTALAAASTPTQTSASASTPTPTPPATVPTTSPSDPNASITSPPPSPTTSQLPYHNPFLPKKNFTTGRWRGPIYGLRQQADLVKLASTHGVVDLLPWTIKKPGEKEKRRAEGGLQVKGTGVGQKVKGKLWERTLKGRLEKRREAMLGMPALIQEWKQKGHGRGWKKWPK